ncbi:L-seryl-tRNA(Sec) selenium transferase [Chloroflexota bacterium]
MDKEFRRLPSVDRLISEERIKQLEGTYPHELLVSLVRQRLERERMGIVNGNQCPSIDEMVESIYTNLYELENPSLGPVINATGVILHTNLGRAPLSQEATAAMSTVAKSYCNLEFDLSSGTRGSRYIHTEQILCQLTGAEAALVVNNNASAVLLGLTALAKRREIIVSRGQAVEIGGSFRIPDVMRQSGAKLMEVGTTNCTYADDYEHAITSRTAALMRVHASNFKVTGFTHSVTLEELVTLGRQYNLSVFDDLGSGCLLDTTNFRLDPEPRVQQSVAIGAGLVFFSGDKLVGGPQAGIIVGKKQLIDKLKKHPLARAARIDKIRLAGLTATLIHYLKSEALDKIPVWRMLSAPLEGIDRRAKKWAEELGNLAQVIEGESMIGGGSLPGSALPTKVVAIGGGDKRKGRNLAQTVARRLRSEETPIIGRISDDVVLLYPHSVLPEDDLIVLPVLRKLAADLKQV